MDNTQKPQKIKHFPKVGYYLLVVGLICVVIAGILGFRTFERIGHRPPPMPRETNVSLIQEWMTIPYISRTYGVPMPELFEKLSLDSEKDSRSSLVAIAKQKNIETDSLINSLKNIISEFQASHSKPPAN